MVSLTQKGFDLIDLVVGEHVANQHSVTAALEEADRIELDRLLQSGSRLSKPIGNGRFDVVAGTGNQSASMSVALITDPAVD